MARQFKKHSPLPGFGITMGWTLFYLTFLVLIPLSTLFYKSTTLSWAELWGGLSSTRTLAAFRLSFVASFAGAALNTFFGLIVAWILVRYSFPGKKWVDGLVDLPFALPTAVAGITLTSLYAANGWIGRFFEPMGIKIAYTEIGIIIALTFIGLPFVVRTVQPVLEDLPTDTEEAAAVLGGGRWRTFRKVILPELQPALFTGFALAFARALGEYGSVVFISGNIQYKTEITPLLIMTKLEEYEYADATAIATVMLLFSFAILLFLNFMSGKGQRRMVGR